MLRTKIKQSAAPGTLLSGVSLMPGESAVARVGVDSGNGDVLMLTDRRLIHVIGFESKKRISFAAIEDIATVELTDQPSSGYGAFVWAGLAFLVAVMLWRVIDSQWVSVGAAIVVALMGVYLIADRLLSKGEHILVFKAGGGEIRVDLNRGMRQCEAERLATKLFELKEERTSSRYTGASKFSPR